MAIAAEFFLFGTLCTLMTGSSRKWCMSEKSYRFFSDGTRVPIAARQSVHCVLVIARALRRIKAEGTHKERSQTRVALAQDWYTSAAHGDVEHQRR